MNKNIRLLISLLVENFIDGDECFDVSGYYWKGKSSHGVGAVKAGLSVTTRVWLLVSISTELSVWLDAL